jgi:hypothetical protein
MRRFSFWERNVAYISMSVGINSALPSTSGPVEKLILIHKYFVLYKFNT